MARTNLAATSLISRQPAVPLTPGAMVLPFAAADNVNGNSTKLTGKELLLVNGGSAGGTITISSSPDPQNRTGDITTYAVAANAVIGFCPSLVGWQQSDGNLYYTCSVATMTVCVVSLPSTIN